MKALLTIVLIGVLFGTAAGLLLFDGTPAPEDPSGVNQAALSGKELKHALSDGRVICRSQTESYPGTSVFVREDDLRMVTGTSSRTHVIYTNDTQYIWRDGERSGFSQPRRKDRVAAPKVPSFADVRQPRDLRVNQITALVSRGPFACYAAEPDPALMDPPAVVDFDTVDTPGGATSTPSV